MNKAVSDKKVVKTIIDICIAEGLKEVVISPGSRNAPLTITFSAHPEIDCFCIVDERSAGFFALGMAQQTGRPVALVCTSGSALLNYAPAIAEAYYQNVPLVVISADRPVEWIDQADGQTIRQMGALDNIVKYSCQLPTSANANTWHVNRMLSEAFYHCRYKLAGPVHINVPLDEPLYGKTVHPDEPQRSIRQIQSCASVSEADILGLSESWSKNDKVLIVVGMQTPDERLVEILNTLSKMEQVVILSETTSNVYGDEIISGIDKVVSTITDEEVHFFKPSLLITFDGAVVSKMVKTFLRNYKAKEHWHISPASRHLDTYQQLTTSIEAKPVEFFDQLLPHITSVKSRYKTTWLNRAQRSDKNHMEFADKKTWSDFRAFSCIAQHVPADWQLQWGNSSAIRYAQLFDAFYGPITY